jgi:hypothetical protein
MFGWRTVDIRVSMGKIRFKIMFVVVTWCSTVIKLVNWNIKQANKNMLIGVKLCLYKWPDWFWIGQRNWNINRFNCRNIEASLLSHLLADRLVVEAIRVVRIILK